MIDIREGDFAEFFETPFACYGRDTNFVSAMKSDLRRSLDRDKNPLFRSFARHTIFTARRQGRPVGRILASVHDASNALHGLRRGHFGLFDCIDDTAVSETLLGAAAEWVAARGCDELAGSFNLTITQSIGVVTAGFQHAPYSYQEYSPPHIARHLVAGGFEPFFPMSTYELEVRAFDPDQLLGPKQAALRLDSAWRIEPVRREGLERQLRDACVVLNDGFANNSMFVPLTPEEFLFPCAGLTWVIDETLSHIARYRGEPVGVLLCIPDLNPFLRATDFRLKWSTPWHLLHFRRAHERAAIIFFSVSRSFHNRGVNALMLWHTLNGLRSAGYTHLGISWISDTNAASLAQMRKLSATRLHRLHLFRKAL